MDTTTTRRGSSVSDKQLGRAAAEGKAVRFYTEGTEKPPVLGYVVGMDDYHWAVGIVSTEGLPLVTLIHRSCPVISISPEETLATEPESYRAWVIGLSAQFREFCSKKYLGKPVPSGNE